MARVVMAIVVVALAVVVVVETASGAQAPATAPTTAPVPPTTPTSPPSTMLPPNLPCVAQLMACADFYQNASVKPTGACCAPLEKAYTSELDCLCAVMTNPALGTAIGVDPRKGMSLFERCGVKVPADVCSSSHAAASGPASSSPTSPPKAGSGASHGAKYLGYPGFLGFLLALWSLLA